MSNFRRIAVGLMSASGGSGVSTIAKELAIYFAASTFNNEPLSVCLVELNMNFGSQIPYFKIAPKQTIADLLKEVRNLRAEDPLHISSFSWDQIEKYITKNIVSGLYILPAPVLGEPELSMSDKDLAALTVTLKEHFDIIIFDTESGIKELSVRTMAAVDMPFLIITDDRNSLLNTQKLRKVLRENGVEMSKLQVILNKYANNRTERLNRLPDIKAKVFMDDLFVIPYEKDVWVSNNLFRPLVKLPHDSAFGKGIQKIAEDILPGHTFRKGDSL